MSEKKTSSSRREFLTFLKGLAITGGAAAFLAPIFAYFWPRELAEVPSEPIAVGTPDSIPVGSGVTVRFGRYPALVINTEAGMRAYSAVCTHFACICKWNPESGVIECPCHEGFFDPQDGAVISGPPPEPLDSIAVFEEDGTLYIGGEA